MSPQYSYLNFLCPPFLVGFDCKILHISMFAMLLVKVNQKIFNKKLKKCRDDSCKSKGTRWDDSCKVKEQDGMTLAKVRHAQVSHAPRGSAKYPTSAACHIISQMHHLETERLYNIPNGQSSRKLKLARAEPSKLTTSSGKALETYN